MSIYIILISSILIFSVLIHNTNFDDDVKENIIAKFGTIAIFLILALKKETVGIDIAGYKRAYLRSALRDWEDTEFIYFEKGYVQLTKFFAKNEIDFQFFMMIIYAVLCISLYLFIKKYSKNATLSLLIFICYQFFVFSISGVRQTIAMAICMFSYTLFDRTKNFKVVISLLLTYSATLFHESAWIFFSIYIITFIFRNKRINIAYYILGVVLSFIMRPFILRFIEERFNRDKNDSVVTLGGAFIFLTLIAIFMWFCIYFLSNKKENDIPSINYDCTRILLATVSAYIILSGSSLLRAVMYLNLFMIPGIPNCIALIDKKNDRVLFNALMGAFLIFLFYVDTLKPNMLELCPYLFYWE